MSFGSSSEAVLPFSSSDSNSLCPHVSYSCSSCGYELNLNSSNRSISAMDEEYGKTMKRGIISFFSIDESRFTQINKVRWLKLFQRRTKLLCRNCGSYIGTASNLDDPTSSSSSSRFQVVKQGWDGISARRTYEIKIRSLRPLSFERSMFLQCVYLE